MAATTRQDKLTKRTLALLRKLVSCPSITPHSAGAMEIVENELAGAGFTLERMDAGSVENLWATHGKGSPTIVLAGHLDVVPPGDLDAWTSDPFTLTERNNQLYGRGATDMKGGVAALIIAALDYVASQPLHAGTIAVLLTTDEEGPATQGTQHVVTMLQQRGERFEHALVGEPSSDQIFGDTLRVGRRGSLTGVITVKGVQGHVAYPQRNSNPIPVLADIVSAISQLTFVPKAADVEPTTIQVVNLAADAGATNVVPAVATATVNFRYNQLDDPSELQTAVTDICATVDMPYSCTWSFASKPYYSGVKCRIAQVITEVCQQVNGLVPQPSVGGGTSDGRFLVDICEEVVEFGSTGLSMHMVDEYIGVDELGPMTLIYAKTLEELLV